MGTIAGGFQCTHVHGLKETTIRLIREEYDPSYTDIDNEEVNHLFRVDGLVEQLEFLIENEDDRSGNSITKDYKNALKEIKGTPDLNKYEYFSMDSVS